MIFMRVRLRNIIIIVFVVFLLIIVIRVTDGIKYILKFFEIAGLYVVLLTLLLLIGILIFLFVFNRNIDRESDIEAKAWNFLQDWWSNKMGMTEPLKLQDGFMKRGYYDSGKGITELFVGFNITKKGSNQRIIFVVGTKPMSIAHFDNSPQIDEEQDPFLNFYPIPPTPVPHYQDEAVKAQFTGARSYGYGSRLSRKTDRRNDTEDDDDEIVNGM